MQGLCLTFWNGKIAADPVKAGGLKAVALPALVIVRSWYMHDVDAT